MSEHLLQDLDAGLSRWLATRLGARLLLRPCPAPPRAWGTTTAAIERVLADGVPMGSAEIAREIGLSRERVCSCISRMARRNPKVERRVHIAAWVLDDGEGRRRYPRALYALGDLPNAKKPRPETGTEMARRYRERNYGQVASVWDLGKPKRNVRSLIR
jgi:hypothetical protein